MTLTMFTKNMVLYETEKSPESRRINIDSYCKIEMYNEDN